MALWGEVNVALNRLVAAGVIKRFWTNLAARNPLVALHVIVSPPEPVNAEDAETIRDKVAAALEPLTEDVTITVDQSGDSELRHP
jgi:hypothetical protein